MTVKKDGCLASRSQSVVIRFLHRSRREIFPKGGMGIDTLSFIGNICSIVGVLLGIASIAFAIYTYVKSKKKK